MSKPVKYIVWICSLLLPLLISAWYICSYATNGVWQDEWSFVEYLKKFEEGNYDLLGLFQYQHNEHKLFIPSLLLILVAHSTRYDGVVVQYVGLIIIALSSSILLTMTWQRARGLFFAPLYLVPVLLLCFSLRQWENLICCFPYSILSVSLFFVVSTFLLESTQENIWCLVGGLVSALLCTFSYGNGLFAWPLGLCQLIASAFILPAKDRGPVLRNAGIWTLVGSLVLAAYFSNYTIRKSFAGYLLINHLTREPGLYGQLFVDALATPLTGYQNWALSMGLVLLVLIVTTIVLFLIKAYRLTKQSVAPMSLILFGLISTLLIFYGRSGMGVQALLCSRYASVTNLWIIGFYLLLITTIKVPSPWPNKMIARLPLAFLVVLMLLGYIISFQEAQAEGERLLSIRLVAANELLQYKIEPDETLMDILPFPRFVRMFAPYLEMRGYSVFNKSAKIGKYPRSVQLTQPYCHFDSAGPVREDVPSLGNMTPRVVTYEAAKFSGWVIDSSKPQQKLAKLFVIIDGKQEFEAACGLYRPDVAEHFQRHEKSYERSGFHFICRPDLFNKGTHTVSIRTIATSGEEYASPILTTFSIH